MGDPGTKSHQMGSLYNLCHFCEADVKKFDNRRVGLAFIYGTSLPAAESRGNQQPLILTLNWCQGYRSNRISCSRRQKKSREQWG